MRILFISRFFNKHGGISRYVVELAERFVKIHETHLLTTKYDYKVANLIVHKKPMIEKPFWLQILSNAYYNTKYANKIKEKFDIDIAYSQGAESMECDVVTMQSCHKAWCDYYRSLNYIKKIRGFINLTHRVVLNIEKKVLEKGSKKIIAISNRVKNEILENYDVPEEKIAVVYSGVNVEEFKPNDTEREKIRARYNIDENDIVLMFIGHEFDRKGLRYVIEALPKIRENVKLFVAGGGNINPYMKLASKLNVRDKVIYLGVIKNNLNQYYSASDIFVFPTLYEPFGLVILEAMASGLPAVVSRLAGASELIEDGYDGILLNDPMNSNEIADKINLLIEDEKLRNLMRKRARKKAENHTWNRVARDTLNVFEEVLRR